MRKYYLDNIRWSVIVLVLVFHVVSIYGSCGAVMSYNAPGIPAMDAIGYLIYPWFMPLLFVVSGICARFSLSKKSGREYIRERVWRLLVPFVFYLILIRAACIGAFLPGEPHGGGICGIACANHILHPDR